MGKSVDIFKIATAKTANKANSKRSPFLKLANHRWSNCINELVNREILKDFIFLCNHDRNEIGERLDRVIKWLNRLYSLLLEKNL